jgi:hypothetical protein
MAADIICTFFNHYANFSWETEMVFDPFFYKQLPRYRRSPREPMVILSLHTPIINVARTASMPSMKTISEELKHANGLLSEPAVTWPTSVAGMEEEGASVAYGFLKSYNGYIRINVQYWGLSLAKGSSVLGWLESRCLSLLVGEFPFFDPVHLGFALSSWCKKIFTEGFRIFTQGSGPPGLHLAMPIMTKMNGNIRVAI